MRAADFVMKQPRVAVIGTGGTFAMQARGPFDWVEYAESGVIHPIAELLKRIGDLAPGIDVVPLAFRTLGSVSITPTDWIGLARLIASTSHATRDGAPDIDAVVITHGTATLEETAWFLDLVLPSTVPVILTGAQRPFDTAGSDAPANLRDALAVAVSTNARGMGALVVMNGLIYAAREVTKAASFELGAFESPGLGPLGRVEADATVTWWRLPVRRAFSDISDTPADLSSSSRLPRFSLDGIESLPRVDIVLSYAGADGVVIDALVAAGTRAIVSAGLPPGRPASGEAAAFAAARRKGVIVVQSTRAARGSVPPQAFLERDGVLPGGDLSPQKLRILLMLALSRTQDVGVLRRILQNA